MFNCFRGSDKINPSPRGEYEIVSPFVWLIKHGYKVDVLEYKDKWLDPGKFDDWIETNRFLLERNVKTKVASKVKQTKLQGEVEIGGDCLIENSEIVGPVSIGSGVIIKNSSVGPFMSISDKCEIQNVTIEDSVLMQNIKIENIKHPIKTSIIGAGSRISDGKAAKSDGMSFFVGEKSVIEL